MTINWIDHLPALQVIIPLIGAPLCTAVGDPRSSWWISAVVSWVSLAIAILLLGQVLSHGTVSYALGGWAAPWGIEYRVDPLNGFILLVVAAVSSIALPFARRSVEREVAVERVFLFYTAWLLSLTGLLGITITADAFNVFVFLEIASLSSYVLVSLGRDPRALMSAFRYLVMGTVGATFFLIGVGLLYALTGTLNMADLAARIPSVAESSTVRVAFGFILVGIGLKIALFPLHQWLPGAYTFAPSSVTVFLAGTATKVAVYVLLRFLFTVFGWRFSFETMQVGTILAPCALAGVLIASTIAIFQSDVKRMLAYSSIAQIGYMVLGVSFASVTGLTATLVHLFNHALMKTALFMSIGCVIYRTGSVSLSSMAGLAQRMPWTMAAFVAASLSLIGVPLTAGFISKWLLLQAALEQGWLLIAAAVVLASLMAVIYTGRVVEAAYFRSPVRGAIQAGVREAPVSMLLPLWILIAANVYFGLHTDLTAGVARTGARMLLEIH